MVSLRCCVSLLCGVICLGPLLGGCADAMARRASPPAHVHPASITTAALPDADSDADADTIMGRAIAEHEKRHP